MRQVLRQDAARQAVLTSTPLEQRRLRIELLRRANELVVSPPRARWKRPLAGALALVAVAVAVALLLRFASPARGPIAPSTTDVPGFQITASQGAEWRTLQRDATLRLSAKRGRFEVAVDRLRTGQRFLLSLPDGEIEVQGTRFVVEADGARTLRVSVLEGRVALRLRDQPPLALSAGDGWTAEPVATQAQAISSATSVGDPAEALPSATSVSSRPPRRQPVDPVRPLAAELGQPLEPLPTSPASTVGRDFALAMAAFSAGDYGRAEELFISFERTNPSDARVEDATFLRALARSRRGDSNGAQAVAREYLRRYPNGLRRIEAERLAK
jgi:TolA-binding protein